MKNNCGKEMKSFINHLSARIQILKAGSDRSTDANKIYNRLIIERACARKKLKELQANNIVSFLSQKLNFKSKQKLICDYFNSK